LPCFFATALLGVVNWELQERVLPTANKVQDALRTQIRSQGTITQTNGRYWLYDYGNIITFQAPTSDNDNVPHADGFATGPASDNEKQLNAVTVLQFARGSGLQLLFRGERGSWSSNKLALTGNVESVQIVNGKVIQRSLPIAEIMLSADPYLGVSDKPSHLTKDQLKERLDQSDSETERRMFAVSLDKRYSTPFWPLVIALFSAPFALSLSRRGRVTTVGAAVGLWLLFIGSTNFFEQFGLNGMLSPTLAVWSPLAIFALLGVYLLSRIKT